MILLIDNYDSFVHNLARYFNRLGQETMVVRNDRTSVEQIVNLDVSAIVISPGPCGPAESGVCLEVTRQLHGTHPMLGVCLGHQIIANALGGNIVRSDNPIHGRSSAVTHSSTGLFAGIPNPTTVARYHSLLVDRDSLPKTLNVTATTDDGAVMAIEHVSYPVFGVQFHPESILTDHGFELLDNFLRQSGIPSHGAADFSAELAKLPNDRNVWPRRPVTF